MACVLVSGAAAAQVPPAQTNVEPAPAGAAKQESLANINDFQEARLLGSTNLAGYTLERCIALTLKNYPRIHEARARLGYRRQQEVQSWSQPYSEFNVTGGFGLEWYLLATT